jgi:ankyrin repeat protein
VFKLLNRVMDQFKAARVGDLQQLRDVLTVDNVNDVDRGWTALHWAASYGHDECVKFCIEMGANVNARTNVGWTPLHFASFQEHVNVVRCYWIRVRWLT